MDHILIEEAFPLDGLVEEGDEALEAFRVAFRIGEAEPFDLGAVRQVREAVEVQDLPVAGPDGLGEPERRRAIAVGGYATTAEAFREFVAYNDLYTRIYDRLADLDVEDTDELTRAGTQIRTLRGLGYLLEPAAETIESH